MIDTIAVTVLVPGFRVVAPKMFGPRRDFPDGGWQRFQNSSPRDRAWNVRRPSLTWSSGGPGWRQERLRIECSLPKIYFGNNLEEFSNADAPDLLDRIRDEIEAMGVEVDVADLWEAKVSLLHVGKNVVLDPGESCSQMIRALTGLPQNPKWDVVRSDLRNGGEVYKLHTNTREIIFYDKLADVHRAGKSPKRAIDPASGRLAIPANMGPGSGTQVIRMEARYNTRETVKRALDRAGLSIPDPRFREMFCVDVAMKLLFRELGLFDHPPGGPGSGASDPLDRLDGYLKDGMSLSSALKAIGLQAVEAGGGPPALLRVLRDNNIQYPAWYRLKGVRRGVSTLGSGREAVVVLLDAVLNYQPLRLGSGQIVPQLPAVPAGPVPSPSP